MPVAITDLDLDDDGWEDMPIVRSNDTYLSGLDDEDIKKYHWKPTSPSGALKPQNATGRFIDVDERGYEWRSKLLDGDGEPAAPGGAEEVKKKKEKTKDKDEGAPTAAKKDQIGQEGGQGSESEYTRLRWQEEEDSDEVEMRTRYLFDEDKAMTPLSQMQTTKNLLSEAQRIAYVGLCEITSGEMVDKLRWKEKKKKAPKELKSALSSVELWKMKIMARLYYHMEIQTEEQKMIESLSTHGVQALDLVPALMVTHIVDNPEYDPELADGGPDSESSSPFPSPAPVMPPPQSEAITGQTQVLQSTTLSSLPGTTTHLNPSNKQLTLDIRWTILCDLFLILIADSVYDSRSRVLLELMARHLGLGWLDVVKFEARVTEALEIQEDIESMENGDIISGVEKSNRKKRYMMLGLATLGGGLVIGLSAGLLAPVIGAGLGAALGTIGIGGTTGFLAGTGGAAVITTGGILTGSGIAVKGMVKRTQQVKTFSLLPLHNNKRVSCIITVPGFLSGELDDPRLPFSVLDPIVGDLFSVLWEPETIRETGSALKILTNEVLTQIGQTVLQATVMTALMSALQWPLILTKLGYLIDNPWNNALDRAKAAGSILADVLLKRQLGVRPITLIGYSLGARVIFYALLKLAAEKEKGFGIVQDVFIMGATLSAPPSSWRLAKSVVSGRFVNAYCRNDWVLNYLFRFTSPSPQSQTVIAGLRPVVGVDDIENVDVTQIISGHMSYRTFMPLILDELGFPVWSDYFDEPGEIEKGDGYAQYEQIEELRGKVKLPPGPSSMSWFGKKKEGEGEKANPEDGDDDLPPREPNATTGDGETTPKASSFPASITSSSTPPPPPPSSKEDEKPSGFDINAIKSLISDPNLNPHDRDVILPNHSLPPTPAPIPGPSSLPHTNTKAQPPLPSYPESDSEPESNSSSPEIHVKNLNLSSPSTSSLVYNPFSTPPSSAPVSRVNLAGTTTPSLTFSYSNPSPAPGGGVGLSFGGTDGSITPSLNGSGGGGVGSKGMNWELPPIRRTNSETASNPWS